MVGEGGTANGVQPAVFGYVDWLIVMAYDGGCPHANYDWSIKAANFWKSRGLPQAKTVLGVPFYRRPGYYTYAQLVQFDPANADRDCVTAGGAQQCYNGLPTIRRKTQWALANAGGIMNWELSQDATGANSLVSAIYETAIGGSGPPARRPTRRPAAPAGSPASPASASTSPVRRAPTAPRSSCTTATAPARSSGRRSPTARCATRRATGAWTRRTTARRTAPACTSGTASPARTSAGSCPDLLNPDGPPRAPPERGGPSASVAA